ncbi:MAG: CDP-alcohol phosphatidyltransferase family protein [Candidatus Planktophila sp.]
MRPAISGYALHVMTASGAAAGLLALQAVIDNNIRGSLLWLLVCQVLDGLDGPIARKIDVVFNAPRVDGYVLDLIVDYVTCVVVPVALMVRLNMLPSEFQTLIAAMILLLSALWFARTDIETDDHWFNGFPAVWNLAVPSFLIFDLSKQTVAVVTVLLAVSQLTNIKFPHLVRVVKWRQFTLPFGVIYTVTLLVLSWNYSNENGVQSSLIADLVMIAFPIYIAIISLVRTFTGSEEN